ncbi:MAG TPA: hypothetical protein VM925_07665 [Labilithrix sp.]|nr:hypothetical protein [Labilithrix sp.]
MRCRSILVTSFALASMIGGCKATWSSTPSSTTGTSSAAADTRSVTGRIASYTTAPKGEMDGFILDTGNRVHFPINTGKAVLPYIQKGEEVRVVGTLADRPDGKVIEATSITNVAKRETINVASVSPPPAAPPTAAPPPASPPAAAQLPSGSVTPPAQSQQTTTLTGAELTTKEGRVRGYTTAPNGDMDGILLDSGSRVHFPVHVGRAVLPLVQQGKSVRIIGWELTGPQGTIIEATKIIATPSGETVDIAAIPLPAARR